LKASLIRRYLKQQERAEAAFRELDQEIAQGYRELAVEPLALCERGDFEGAWQHIQWLRLDDSEMLLFWTLFDSTQRRLMKAAGEESRERIPGQST